MRTFVPRLRLPSALPVRPRLSVLPLDVNGWTD